MPEEILKMSNLNKTWVFDFDGTLVEHNKYKTGNDAFLPGAEEFLKSIPQNDFILIMTAREKEARKKTEAFLHEHNIRYNEILFEMPVGERILFNDSKPSGLKMAYAVERKRNQGLAEIKIVIDKTL
jgi:FMN phosphatase YigB (HAD superfamily)